MYQPITVNYCQRNHDRFLIIDDVVYIFGASLVTLGSGHFVTTSPCLRITLPYCAIRQGYYSILAG